jgi:lysophospholipase L1-like esterase
MKKSPFFLLIFLIFACNKANPVVMPNTPDQTIRKIAAWGDSFTSGGGVTMPEYVYPVQLQKLSGYEVYNGGIGGQTSTQIKTRMLAAPDKKDYNAIIWVGTNNYWQPQIVKADIAEMVSFLGHKRFLVLSLFNDKFQTKGTMDYITIVKLNNDLKELYPDNYVDVRAYLISLADNSAQDQQDKANDVIPTSLRSDNSHPNDKAYHLIAEYIYNNFSAIHK